MSTRSTAVREAVGASSARFEARARAARWRSRRPGLLAAGLVVVLVALGVVGWAGPVLVVRSVTVTGVAGAQAGQVRTAGDAARGTPLLQVDTGALAEQVGGLPFVAGVQVERAWPSTLRLVVTPREPAAAVPRTAGGYRLVDAGGVVYAVVSRPPKGVPVVKVPLSGDSRAALTAALTVLDGLPPALRRTVSQVSATTPDDVRMRVGGSKVVWGSADQTPFKARVLSDLMRRRATVYDVSSPHTPVLR